MCGFAGHFLPNGVIPPDNSLDYALDLLRHRGPDSTGKLSLRVSSGYIEFGFRRLAIIDLSSDANQPFISQDERFVLVFNGEIYNYVELRETLISKGRTFQTNSDTEVLITAWLEWGVDSLSKFIGMFSIAIFDKFTSEIWCARDAYGIKPFYYSNKNGSFVFASEIHALMSLARKSPVMNRDIAMQYVINGEYDRSRYTFFDGVLQLQPGHFLKISLGDSKPIAEPQRWWFPKVEENLDLSFSEAAEELRDTFLESVSLHLRSDVKFATALSGGLDSSAIICAIRALQPEVELHTFSFMADDPNLDESVFIGIINRQVGAVRHQVDISPQSFSRDIEDLIRTQGEPFGSTSLYAQYRVYQSANESGFKVVLDGQGADELLAGYHGYPESRIRSLIDDKDYAQVVSFISNWAKLPGRDVKSLLQSSAYNSLPSPIGRVVKSVATNMRIPKFIKGDPGIFPRFPEVYADRDWTGRRLSERLLKEQSNGALVSLLRHSDRNSMRWSIESRVPFLNPKLSQLLSSFPEKFLLSDQGETKSVFKESMRGIVDQQILDRKDKIGFTSPQIKWVTRDLLNEDSLRDGILSVDFFDQKLVQRYLAQETVGGSREMNQKWRIYNLIKWRQIFSIGE
jgi:asparagine synthase (glutamine-hydrolysing)